MSDFLYSIDHILSEKECKYYIKFFDNHSNIEKINDTHRKYFRVIFYDDELANKLYEKIKFYIPKKIKKISVGMNKCIRLSKYDSGQFFGIHKDGINFDKDNKQIMSYATLNIFLNDNFQGGETTFYDNSKKNVTLNCKPKIGRGSFFYSQQYHEGKKITKGFKYLLRTDLMINHNK